MPCVRALAARESRLLAAYELMIVPAFVPLALESRNNFSPGTVKSFLFSAF